MIGYDAKGLETECFKHWLNSPEANRVLDGDIHTDNAKILSELIGREIDREWGAKTSWYAWMFGCYPPKLALILKCSIAHATQIFEEVYPNRIPGLKKLLDSVQYEWRTNKGRIECIDGGFVLCPSLNASLNYKIQPTGAVVMKMASILLKEQTEEKGIWNRKLLDVHDEGQHSALEKDIYIVKSKNKKGEEIDLLRHPFGDTAVESIREAGRVLKFNVPLDGSYEVGYTWAETH
jgi:DNA polymerase I-like protein with 3'-5' exonuclease and polymerase domains